MKKDNNNNKNNNKNNKKEGKWRRKWILRASRQVSGGFPSFRLGLRCSEIRNRPNKPPKPSKKKKKKKKEKKKKKKKKKKSSQKSDAVIGAEEFPELRAFQEIRMNWSNEQNSQNLRHVEINTFILNIKHQIDHLTGLTGSRVDLTQRHLWTQTVKPI